MGLRYGRLVLILLVTGMCKLSVTCASAQPMLGFSESQEQEKAPPNVGQTEIQLKPLTGDRSEPLFPETINERAEAANLPPLKSKDLNGNNLEFRVWVGFGMKPLEGFVIKRADGRWEGMFLESMNATTKPPYVRELSSPKSGWNQLWSLPVDSSLLSLPDSSQLKDEIGIRDGTSYVVEVKKDGIYRTYAYLNPDYQRWQEAKQVLRIADILYGEFGIKR